MQRNCLDTPSFSVQCEKTKTYLPFISQQIIFSSCINSPFRVFDSHIPIAYVIGHFLCSTWGSENDPARTWHISQLHAYIHNFTFDLIRIQYSCHKTLVLFSQCPDHMSQIESMRYTGFG